MHLVRFQWAGGRWWWVGSMGPTTNRLRAHQMDYEAAMAKAEDLRSLGAEPEVIPLYV